MFNNYFPNTKLATAKYTTLLKDVTENTLSSITLLFNTFGVQETLLNMFLSKYRYNEICDKDESIFIQCVTDVFNEYKDYYTEMLTNYTKQYDYATGNKKVITRTDSSHSEGVSDTTNTNNSANRNYDMPNKVVNPDDESGYLTSKDTHDGNSNVNTENENSSTYDSSVTTEYKNEFLDLKRKYLSQIRNLYSEFADRFMDCFLHVY